MSHRLDFVLDAVGDQTIQSTMTHLKPFSKYVSIVMPILPATDNYGLVGGLAKSALDFNYNYAKVNSGVLCINTMVCSY